MLSAIENDRMSKVVGDHEQGTSSLCACGMKDREVRAPLLRHDCFSIEKVQFGKRKCSINTLPTLF